MDMIASRTCTCGATADGVPLSDLLADGWTVWHTGDSYMTCPRCSAVIFRLESAVARGTLTREHARNVSQP